MSARPTTRPHASPGGDADPLSTTFRALDQAGIRWCLLRGRDTFSAGGDIDLLVSRDDRAALDRVLEGAAYVRIPSWGYGTHAFFLRREEDLDRWLKLDVVTELAFGRAFSFRTGAERACLARRRRDDGEWVLAEDDALWALLLHRLLDKGTIDERSAGRLRALRRAADGDGPLAKAVAAVAPPAWPPSRILDALDRGDLAALEEGAGPALAHSWSARARSEAIRRRLTERAARGTARLATAWRRPGIRVAVLGPDGAGKSTLAEGLRGSFPLPVRSIYLAPFPAGSAGGRLPGIGFGRRLIRIWRGWLRARAHAARGRLVIFDRYPLDARIAPRRPLGPLGRLRRWIVGHSCPVPDLVLVLDVPGAVVHRRKGELDPGTLESERRQYAELAARLPRATTLDATQDPDDVRRRAVGIVWRHWTERWRTP